jgi:hypothetical protein
VEGERLSTPSGSLALPPLDDEGKRLCHTLEPQLYARLFSADEACTGVVGRRMRYAPFDLMEPSRRSRDARPPATARSRSPRTAARRSKASSTLAAGVLRCSRGILDVARPKPAPDLLFRVSANRSPRRGGGLRRRHQTGHHAAAAAEVAYVGVGERVEAAGWCARSRAAVVAAQRTLTSNACASPRDEPELHLVPYAGPRTESRPSRLRWKNVITVSSER